MKIMLDEIERKKADAEQARLEEERRARERGADAPPARHAPSTADTPAAGSVQG
jgi:hypothetical protein